jgi:hypothetical protein
VVLVTAQGFPLDTFLNHNETAGELQAERITKGCGGQPAVLRFPSGFSEKNRRCKSIRRLGGAAENIHEIQSGAFSSSIFIKKSCISPCFYTKTILPALTPRSGGANLYRR